MNLGGLILYPASIAAGYSACVFSLVKEAGKIVKSELVEKLEFLDEKNFNRDDYIDDLEKAQKKLEKSLDVDKAMIAGCVLLFGKKIMKFSKKQIKKSLKKIRKQTEEEKKDLDQILKSYVSSNAESIRLLRKTIADKSIDKIKEGFRSGDSISKIKKDILDTIEATQNYSKLSAKNSIVKFHSVLLKYDLQKLGYTEYVWVTMEDDRVRKSHEVLNQKIVSWGDVSLYKNQGDQKWKKKSSIGGVLKQVGEDYNCRCGFKPVLEPEQ